VRCEFPNPLPGGSKVSIKYDMSFKDVNLTNSQSVVAQAVSVQDGKQIIMTTADGNFFSYQKDLGQLLGPVPLPGQPTALKTFAPLADVYFVGFS